MSEPTKWRGPMWHSGFEAADGKTPFLSCIVPKDVFEALMAVVKAADADLVRDFAYDAPTDPDLREALMVLDAAYPGWQKWT